MDFIVQHAKDNVWAEPIQDKDYYIKPARITPNGGSFRYAEVGMAQVALPNSISNGSKYYHVYHIGQLPPQLLGVELDENKWINIDVIADKMECYVNIFLDNGYVVPRSKCYLMRMWPGKNILLAIEHDTNISYNTTKVFDPITNAQMIKPITLNNQDINIRFYTNDRYHSPQQRENANNADNQMYFETKPLTNRVVQDIKAAQVKNPKPGWYVLDGHIMDYNNVILTATQNLGKEISIYHDETIISIEYHRLQDLRTFTSVKNRNIKKYLINLTTPVDRLVYFNDVEYYLGKIQGGGFNGLCIPMVRANPVSTITNKTQAIRTDIITDLMSANDWLDTSEDVYLMVVVRQGGMIRGLVHQHTRIEELLKLPENVVLSALSGVNSLMEEWKAATLEQDDYATIIAAEDKAIIADRVFNAYGYNAITRYHHPNPLPVSEYTQQGAQSWFMVQLSNAASERNRMLSSGGLHIEVIEYDKDGLYIGRRRFPYSNGGSLVALHDPVRKTALIEHYINNIEDSSLNLGELFNLRIENNDLDTFGFAAYITTSTTSVIKPKWIDVTKIPSYYHLTTTVRTDGSKVQTLIWNQAVLNEIGARPMVRINNRVCFKTYNAKDLTKGYRSFPTIVIPNNSSNRVQVEPGSIEIWMENRLLIEDIDYVVDWPNIYIGRRIQNLDTAKIHLRLTGLADSYSGIHDKARETGFVKDGYLSVDKHYDIRNDRNIQINVGGTLLHRDKVSFDEDKGTRQLLDGRPYQIRDYITPIELYTNRSTYSEKEKSEEVDEKVMGYLNEYLTTTATDIPTINHTRWLVVSVFLDDIIGRLMTGWLSNELKVAWTSEDADRWVRDVLYLLKVDVTLLNDTNRNYVRLIPHGRVDSVALSQYQYKFVDYLAKKYLEGFVQINHMVTITNGV